MPVASGTMRADDREAIRDVLHNYCRGVDRRDLELLKSCYHEDAIDQHASFTGNGHAFCEYAMRELQPCIFTQHRISNIRFEFDADRAFTECYVSVVHRVDANGTLVDFCNFGRFCDVHELRGASWKIAYRLHLPDGDNILTVEELAGRKRGTENNPSRRYFVRGQPGPGDASYLKFQVPTMRRDIAPITDMWNSYLSEWSKRKNAPASKDHP